MRVLSKIVIFFIFYFFNKLKYIISYYLQLKAYNTKLSLTHIKMSELKISVVIVFNFICDIQRLLKMNRIQILYQESKNLLYILQILTCD